MALTLLLPSLIVLMHLAPVLVAERILVRHGDKDSFRSNYSLLPAGF